MDLSPLFESGAVIVFHTGTAILSLLMGLYIFARPKGTAEHILMGRIWIAAMTGVVASSFMIFEIRLLGPFSPIHLLSIGTAISLYLGWKTAREKKIEAHFTIMILMWTGALGLNVWFTLLPGRILHQVFFGG